MGYPVFVKKNLLVLVENLARKLKLGFLDRNGLKNEVNHDLMYKPIAFSREICQRNINFETGYTHTISRKINRKPVL